MACLSYHLRGNSNPLEATTKKEREEASETTKEDAETEPNIFIAGDTLNDPLGAGQEDVIMDTTIELESVILGVGVH